MGAETSIASYRTLGRTGLRVSPLALGAMTFGTEWGWGSDKETAREIFQRYMEAGGNFFDTAESYTNGTSERWLGEFIADAGSRDRAVITTKFSAGVEPGNPNGGGNGRKNIIRAVEGSLERLGTDYIDLYILHAWDGVTPVEEVVRTFDDLVRAGKIRHAGLSNIPSWYAARAQTVAELRSLEPIAALQMEYSLIQRSIEHEFVSLCNEYEMGVMAWSPLASGLLSGKYRSVDGKGDGRLNIVHENSRLSFPTLTPRNVAIIAELESVSAKLGRPMAQVALNWVASRPAVASAIVGATSLDQLDQNLGAMAFEIPADLIRNLDAASSPEPVYPYTFFEGEMRQIVNAGTQIGKGQRR